MVRYPSPMRSSSWTRRSITLALGMTMASTSAVAAAEQFVVIDETWTHSPDLADSHKRFDPAVSTPGDWVSPIDYSQGTAYVYLEVHTKPTAQETKFQVCFEATPTYACTAQSPTYTTTGTYEWATPFASFWSPPNESVDWTLGTKRIACILKDTMNNKPSADNVGDEVAALYMPTEVRMVVTVVSPGGTYVPPTPTGEGGAGGTGEGGSGGDPTTAGSGGAGSGTGGASAGGSATTSGGANDGAPSSSEEEGGCSFTSASRHREDGWALTALVVALGAAARRRRA